MQFYKYIFIYLNLVLFINSQDLNKICKNKETCSECIQDGCIWCSKTENTKSGSQPFTRCIEESKRTDEWCPDNFVTIPKTNLTILKNSDLNSDDTNNKPIVQIRPQRVHLKLRLNEKKELHFQYSQAVDYPVDLYYLMDASESMDKIQSIVSELGGELAKAMKKLTKNFRLGFGTFVDKVVRPFTDLDAVKNEKRKREKKTLLSPPFSFRNNLPLNENAGLFMKTVNTTLLSTNVDSPEGGFDAILQSIVCEQIGWRSNATRLLVFSTDAPFHQAGDGKLAGVIEPHDGKCYLDANGYYTQSLKFDYPSIALLNHYVKKHNIDLIFAVTQKVAKIYDEVKDRIQGSQLAIIPKEKKKKLNKDQVITLIMDKYKYLKQSVTITDNATSDVYIEYFTSCTEGPEQEPTNKCLDIRYNKPVNFTVVIQAISCKDKNHVIEIKPRSLSESLIVELELQCECECEQPKHKEINSPQCSSHGTFNCGICSCNPGRVGNTCECNETEGEKIVDSCKIQNSIDDLPCSGHGTCKCGKCVCDKDYSGAYCQCDNFSCPRYKNEICSGNGVCDCHECKCNPGFNETACQCDTRRESCIASGSHEVCSGKGTCHCGECRCNKHPIRYRGKFCQICSSCPGKQCSEFVDCVECRAFPVTAKYSKDECDSKCANVSVKNVEKIEKYNDNDEALSLDYNYDNYYYCESINENDECTTIFRYYDSNQQLTLIEVQKHKICPQKVDFLPILLKVSGTILLGGIMILVIWKICTEVHDRREYARFEEEQQASKWHRDDNPLYRGATTTVSNPMFNKRITMSH